LSTFHSYEGPSIDLSLVRAYITIYQRENSGRSPTEDELVRKVHEKYYRALPESWIRERVRGAIEIGLERKLIEEKNESEMARYDRIEF